MAQIHYIPIDSVDLDDHDVYNLQDHAIRLNYDERQQLVNTHNIKKGDVIAYRPKMYRNSWKSVYDGNDIVQLDYTLDEYGALPSSLTIGDRFDIDHWKDVIEHNTIVWLDSYKYRDELLEQLRDYDTKLDGHYRFVVGPKGNRYNIHVIGSEVHPSFEDKVRRGDVIPFTNYNRTLLYPWSSDI